MKIRFFSSLIISLLFLSFFLTPVKAEDFFYAEKISYPPTDDFIFISPEKEIKIQIKAGANDGDINLKAMMLAPKDEIGNFYPYPENFEPASDLYLIRFDQNASSAGTPKITLKYSADNRYKEIYYYNEIDSQFEKLNSERDGVKDTLTFSLTQNKIIFALFNEPEIAGVVSWYVHPKYKKDFIAASRDFAKDSKLRVVNEENGTEIIVTIKDYGPKKCADWTEKENKKMGPCQERILDLSKMAFQALGSIRQGIMRVRIVPLEQ